MVLGGHRFHRRDGGAAPAFRTAPAVILRTAVGKVAEEANEMGKIGGVGIAVPEARPGGQETGDATARRVQALTGKLAELEPLGLPVGFPCLRGVDLSREAAQLLPAPGGCWRASLAEGPTPWLLWVVG